MIETEGEAKHLHKSGDPAYTVHHLPYVSAGSANTMDTMHDEKGAYSECLMLLYVSA